MSALTFEAEWLGDSNDAELLAEVRVVALGQTLTRVHDSISRTVRDSVRVSASRIAIWMVSHWWRLRWEPSADTAAFARVHNMAGLGGGYVWPPISFSSDGEFVEVALGEDSATQPTAIRYLGGRLAGQISASDFESGIESFLDLVEGRLADVRRADRLLRELRDELREERADPHLARLYRLHAHAGFDAGDASEEQGKAIAQLARMGDHACEDLVAGRDVATAQRAADEIAKAAVPIDLLRGVQIDAEGRPWEKGASAARRARALLGVTVGPLSTAKLEEALGVRVAKIGVTSKEGVAGAYRDESGGARVLLRGSHPTQQRFGLARVLGLGALRPQERLLPLTQAATAGQRFARAFAQELLCPWDELSAFTDENGVGEESVLAAAHHWGVSEWSIQSSLQNHGRLDRRFDRRFD